VFKQEHRMAIAEGQLRTALESELEERREAEPLAYPEPSQLVQLRVEGSGRPNAVIGSITFVEVKA
jgi:hypothetical protein